MALLMQSFAAFSVSRRRKFSEVLVSAGKAMSAHVTHASKSHVGCPGDKTGTQAVLIGSLFAVAPQHMLEARHEVAVVIHKVKYTADVHLRHCLKDRMVDW